MPSTLMDHAGQDPRQALLEKVGDLSKVEVFGNDILVAIYKRPEKTKSGIYLTDAARSEDVWQGKAFLVLKMGPTAFIDDEGSKFRDISEGDWVCARASDGWAITLNSEHGNGSRDAAIECRVITDINIRMRVSSPDTVY